MNKHTPGPWHVEQRKIHFHIIAADLTRVVKVLYVGYPDGRTSLDQARLIAAAPEMLEALNHALGLLNNADALASYEYRREAEVIIGAAIAKAEGQK